MHGNVKRNKLYLTTVATIFFFDIRSHYVAQTSPQLLNLLG